RTCCSPPPAPRSPACAPSPTRSCRPSRRARWCSPRCDDRRWPQSSRRTRFRSTLSLLSSLSYLIGHLVPAAALPVTLEGYQPPSLKATSTLSPLLHLATGLPGPSIDQARASSSPKVMSSAPPSIRAMHRLPDLEASRAVTDHHASSCMTKNRAPGLQPAGPPVLADVVLAGAAGACGLVPA